MAILDAPDAKVPRLDADRLVAVAIVAATTTEVVAIALRISGLVVCRPDTIRSAGILSGASRVALTFDGVAPERETHASDASEFATTRLIRFGAPRPLEGRLTRAVSGG